MKNDDDHRRSNEGSTTVCFILILVYEYVSVLLFGDFLFWYEKLTWIKKYCLEKLYISPGEYS